jgi:hypothetical protein
VSISALGLGAQTVCQPTPTYSPCEIAFELSAAEMTAHPHPYRTVNLEAEFRSPRFRTFRMPAFWDGGNRMVIRFAPTEAGQWTFRTSSNVTRFDGVEEHFFATASDSHGFLRPANVHHWAFVDENVRTPQLWMGDTLLPLPYVDRALFERIVDARAAQKFNHLRGVVLSAPGAAQRALKAGEPEAPVFRELDARILYMNGKGMTADLVLAWSAGQWASLFPSWEDRRRFLRYLVARFSPMQVTWQLAASFENDDNARALLKEVGQALKSLDPYLHPRSTGALNTTSPLSTDEWMNFITYGAADDHLGSIEHQLYPAAFVNLNLGAEDSGAGGTDAVDADTFRHHLWNASMDGQYPTFANTGTSGVGGRPVDANSLDSPAAKQMAIWYDFFAGTRHWELEPYFELDGGRALALERPDEEEMEGIEYVVYIEKPGPVDVLVQKRGYDVEWFNPVSGQRIREKKPFKGDHFTGEPPDRLHDWVLHLFREGRLESMLRSYKFDSRPIIMQEIEQAPQKVPFDVAEPASDPISVSKPPKYAAKLTRETKATRSMMWLWAGEIAADQQGPRVLGSGLAGTFHIPANLTSSYPAMLTVRLYGMNAHGKVYMLLRVYQLSQ